MAAAHTIVAKAEVSASGTLIAQLCEVATGRSQLAAPKAALACFCVRLKVQCRCQLQQLWQLLLDHLGWVLRANGCIMATCMPQTSMKGSCSHGE